MGMYVIIIVSKVLFPTGLCVLEQGIALSTKNPLLVFSILVFRVKIHNF